jgi:hypothetical protein
LRRVPASGLRSRGRRLYPLGREVVDPSDLAWSADLPPATVDGPVVLLIVAPVTPMLIVDPSGIVDPGGIINTCGIGVFGHDPHATIGYDLYRDAEQCPNTDHENKKHFRRRRRLRRHIGVCVCRTAIGRALRAVRCLGGRINQSRARLQPGPSFGEQTPWLRDRATSRNWSARLQPPATCCLVQRMPGKLSAQRLLDARLAPHCCPLSRRWAQASQAVVRPGPSRIEAAPPIVARAGRPHPSTNICDVSPGQYDSASGLRAAWQNSVQQDNHPRLQCRLARQRCCSIREA